MKYLLKRESNMYSNIASFHLADDELHSIAHIFPRLKEYCLEYRKNVDDIFSFQNFKEYKSAISFLEKWMVENDFAWLPTKLNNFR